jgi:hypothetical protein
MNEKLASVKENEAWELVNWPFNAKVIKNRQVLCVKTLCSGKARFKARLVAKVYAQNKGLIVTKYLVP